MVETSGRFIIDYLLSSNRGELIKKNDRETNFMKIDKKNATDMIRPKQSPTDLNLNSIKLNRPLTSNDMN